MSSAEIATLPVKKDSIGQSASLTSTAGGDMATGDPSTSPAAPTPGPWSVEGEHLRAFIRGADGTIVALRHRLPAAVHVANFASIVRACNAHDDLVASLRSLIEAFDAHQLEMNSPDISQDIGQGVHPWHEEWMHHARRAYAKATGDQP